MRLNDIKNMTVGTMLVLTLAACGNDGPERAVDNDSDGVSIMFSSAAVSEIGRTRADASDTYNTTLPGGSDIGVFIYDCDDQPVKGAGSSDGDKIWVYQTVGTADATTLISSLQLTSHYKNPQYPTVSGDPNTYKTSVKVFAVFPCPASSVDLTTTSYTFSVALDQTVADNIIASDLLATEQKTYNQPHCQDNTLQLDLKHRMAKVLVTLTPKTGSDLTAANIPEAFDVLNVVRSVTIRPKAGTITTNTSEAKTSELSPLKGLTTQAFFLPPQSLTADTELLKFNILASGNFKGINGATFKVPTGGVTFEAGKVYHINVTVDVDFVTMTGTITPWIPETISYTEYTDSIL